MNNILLCGFMGCGKTTVGKRLAALTGREYIDLDHEIELEAGMTIPELFERFGEQEFRDREHAAVAAERGRGAPASQPCVGRHLFGSLAVGQARRGERKHSRGVEPVQLLERTLVAARDARERGTRLLLVNFASAHATAFRLSSPATP